MRTPSSIAAREGLRGLIRYRIANQSAAVAEAADICPTDAIVQDDGAWQIDDAKCIRCNACKERAPPTCHRRQVPDAIPLQTIVRANVAPPQIPALPRG